MKRLIHLLDGGTREVILRCGATLCKLIATALRLCASRMDLRHDRRALTLQLVQLLLVLVLLGQGVVVEPADGLLAQAYHLIFIGLDELVAAVLDCLFHREHVALDLIARLYLLALLLVLFAVALRLGQHPVDLRPRQASLVVGNADVVGATASRVLGGDGQDAVGVDVEGDVDLRYTTGRWGDVTEFEAAEQMVILGHRALTLVHLNGDGRLIVGVGSECLRLLAGYASVALDDVGHDAASGFNAERQRRNVDQQDILESRARLALARENSRLYGSAVSYSLVGVDGQVQLLAAEEVLQHRLDLGDASRTADEDDFVDRSFVHFSVGQSFLHGLQGGTEQVGAELLEARPRDFGVVVDAVVKCIDLDARLGAGRQGAFGPLGRGSQTAQGSRVHPEVFFVFALELLAEVVDETVVKVLATEVGVARRGFHLEERALVDGEDRHVEGAAAQVEYEDVLLPFEALIETVGECCGGGLVDDPQYVETGYGSSVFGGLTLRVVEVSRYCYNRLLHLLSQVRLCCFLHFCEDHGADFLRIETFLLALELDLDLWFAALVDDCERPVFQVALDLRVVISVTEK